MKIIKWLRGHKEIEYIGGLFVATRLALLMLGFFSLELFKYVEQTKIACMAMKDDIYTNRLINMWFNWDSGHYYTIATTGYTVSPANYGFFPLYPLLLKPFIWLHLNPVVAGLIVSNVALFVACLLLYKLVLKDHGEDVAKRSVKYLLLLPAAFVFSGMLTESLFVMLAIASLYAGRNNKWVLAGVLGALLALTRHVGVLIAIPLFVEYLQQRQFKIKNIRFNILALAIIPLGTFLYMLYNKKLMGSYLGFAEIQTAGAGFINPLAAIWHGLGTRFALVMGIAAAFIATLLVGIKKIRPSLWIYAFIFALLPLMTGPKYYPSIIRYMVVVFPVAILFAQFAKTKLRDDILTIVLVMIQALFMIAWVNCWTVMVV